MRGWRWDGGGGEGLGGRRGELVLEDKKQTCTCGSMSLCEI